MPEFDTPGAPADSSSVPPSSVPRSSSALLQAEVKPDEWGSSLAAASARRSRALPWIAVASLVAIAGALGAWWAFTRQPAAITTLPIPTSAPTPDAVPATAAPTLDGYDEQVRTWAAGLSNAKQWLTWLSGPDLVRRLVGALWTVSQGDSPRKFVAFLSPGAPFAVEARAGRIYTSPRSFARYSAIAQVAQSFDSEKAAAGWRALEPFLARAHQEIAPRGRTIQQTFDDATAQLLRVPVPEGDVELVEKGAIYAYADPELERLSPAQKHLLRLGPTNARAVQAKIRELREALGLADIH
jgi:Protein of unknown function (DUF3014)